MADLDVREVRSIMGRIEVVLGPGATWEGARDRLRHVFGIANFAVARRTAPDLDVLIEALLTDLQGRSPRNFRVTARRADKRFPMPSPDIERLVGARVQAAFGWPVNLDNPELNIRIEFVSKDAFYSFGKERGPGGLPVGRERPCRVPAVGRHRLAGGCVADDAPRVLRAARALPQLSVSRGHVAGEGPGDRHAARALSTSGAAAIRCRSVSCSGRSWSQFRRRSASSSTGG